jgi:hypothetical protein
MDQLINQNLEERERTRAALAHKIELAESRLRENIDEVRIAVRHSLDWRYQLNKRPWAMLGVSLLVGAALGAKGASSRRQRARYRAALSNNVLADPSGRQIGVIRTAIIGAIASVASEVARHIIPTIVKRLEERWPAQSNHHRTNGANGNWERR